MDITKDSKIRPNSKMAFIVKVFNEGTKKTADIAKLLAAAELDGTVTGLKKIDEAAIAKKTDSYYRKTVNWYLNQAKHKKFIDAPFALRNKKQLIKEVVAGSPLVQETPATVTDSAPTAAPVVTETQSDDLIPSI